MIVVSNSGPLIALSRINKLNLLKHYFSKIYVSNATYDELVIKGKGKPGSDLVQKVDWIQSKKVKDNMAVKVLELELDLGESETIILAQEMKADLVLLDESIARQIAKTLDLKVKGSIAILVMAKKDKLLPELKPILDELRQKKVWIGDDIYEEALKLVDEI